MEVDTLIDEMKAVKAANPTLEIADVLKIFEIQAIKDLSRAIRSIK